MAERRMFAKTIIDSDKFLDMPLSTQALYFHLSMRADDEGFISNPKKIMRMIGSDEDSMKLLIAKQFIIPFESGIVVIKHWKIHNYIQSDRFKETICTEERKQLGYAENREYVKLDTECIHDVSSLETQYSIGKNSIDKISIDKDSIDSGKPQKHKHGEFNHVLLTDDEYSRLCIDYGPATADLYITKVDEYCEQSGKRYKNYNLAIRNTFMARDNVKPVKVNTDPGYDPVNGWRTDF